MFVGRLMVLLNLSAIASATLNALTYVNNTLEAMKTELTENGTTSWAQMPQDISLQRESGTAEFSLFPDKNLSMIFFRAYFTGLETLKLEDPCSMKTRSKVVTIECLLKFPYAKFTAYGDLLNASTPLIHLIATMEDHFLVMELKGGPNMTLTKFYPGTGPIISLRFLRNPIPTIWQTDVSAEIRKWVRSKFVTVVDGDIRRALSNAVSRFPLPGAEPNDNKFIPNIWKSSD